LPELPPKGQTVSVACKLPHGLVLELNDSKMEAPTPAAQPVKVYFPTGEKVTLTGSLADHRFAGYRGKVVNGFGITEVNAEFWAKWLEQNRGFPPLTKGWLFAQPTADRLYGQTKEHVALKTGLEPVDQDHLPPGIQKADAAA
jgi:hypothetical protein